MTDDKIKPSIQSYVYTVEDFSGTVGDYLRRCHDYSGRMLTTLAQDGLVTRNGVFALFKNRCSPGDVIEVRLAGEYPDCAAEDMPVEVIHEDEDILVINKTPGMVVHPTKSHPYATLANAVYGMWEKRGYVGKIHFVSRLDMDTSGVIVIAKNKYVHHYLQNWFSAHPGRKVYYALAAGTPPQLSGTVTAPIALAGDGIKRCVSDAGSPCRTDYETLAAFSLPHEYSGVYADGKVSLLKLRLYTGRTHQIRVHLQYLGLSILGDTLYGGDTALINRQALHCGEISFVHPRTLAEVLFSAPLPADMSDLAAKLSHSPGNGKNLEANENGIDC